MPVWARLALFPSQTAEQGGDDAPWLVRMLHARRGLGLFDIGRCGCGMGIGAFVGLAEVETVGRDVAWPSRAAAVVRIG